MKVILLGNAGSGKTTLAPKLLESEFGARLSLDELAFAKGAERRPSNESIAEAMHFIEANKSWVVEGCYSDIIASLLPFADTLIFLNPGIEACVRHCKTRPWEPTKFASPEEQAAHLENLIDWVSEYASRDDEYGLRRHRILYEAFKGKKFEYTHPTEYPAQIPV